MIRSIIYNENVRLCFGITFVMSKYIFYEIYTTVESRYLEYSISRTLDVLNETIGPILINLHKMTTR